MKESNVLQTAKYFRLPRHGIDPTYGLSCGQYYSLAKAGEITLVRVVLPGCKRGTTLVEASTVEACLLRSKENINFVPALNANKRAENELR